MLPNHLFMPYGEAPEYTPIKDRPRLIDTLYPNRSLEVRAVLEHDLISNMMVNEDAQGIAELILSGKRFDSKEDYAAHKRFVLKAIMLLNHDSRLDFFDLRICEMVDDATKTYYETKGKSNGS